MGLALVGQDKPSLVLVDIFRHILNQNLLINPAT